MKYLILGAGPSGLSFANKIKQMGETSFLVLEHEKEAGGLCRSTTVDGYPFDIGGGHFLDVRRPNVNKFLFGFMPEEEWNIYDRDSRIFLDGEMIEHPIEANIWQMSIDKQVEYLKSIAKAGCNQGISIPEYFIDWIYWKLGDKIASAYMIPYNMKMFSDELNELGTYWLDKLPDVSFEDTLRSCLMKHAYGSQPGHARFYYPQKHGYGELWLRMADELGDKIEYGKTIKSINSNKNEVTVVDGETYSADMIITTIPWNEFDEIIGMPEQMKKSIGKLKYSSIETRFFEKNLDTNAHWIYYPDPDLPYHRILVRHNFCKGSTGYWTETRKERSIMFPEEEHSSYKYLNKYAYPLNTVEKPIIIMKILKWANSRGIYGLGRWGEHQHYNSDVTVDLAMKMAEKLSCY